MRDAERVMKGEYSDEAADKVMFLVEFFINFMSEAGSDNNHRL